MNSYWVVQALAQKVIEIAKIIKILFSTNRIHFKIVRRRTETTHQQRKNQ